MVQKNYWLYSRKKWTIIRSPIAIRKTIFQRKVHQIVMEIFFETFPISMEQCFFTHSWYFWKVSLNNKESHSWCRVSLINKEFELTTEVRMSSFWRISNWGLPGDRMNGEEGLSCNTAFDGRLISRYAPNTPWEALLRIGLTPPLRDGEWVGKRLFNSRRAASGSQWAINFKQTRSWG